MRPLILATALYGMILPVLAVDKPVIKTCTENDESYPWILKDRPGVTNFQLKLVEKQVGAKLDITPLPWKRCLEELRTGAMDAAFKLSYSPARAAELGVYPMAGGKLDASKRLLMSSYSLYRLKGAGANVSWDGKALKANGPVGAQTGFSIGEQLISLGITVDDGARAAKDHLHKLALSRIVAVALQTEEGDMSIATDPELRDRIEKVQPVLVEKPYFLIFSKQFHAKNPEYAQEIWNAIETARESPEYKKHVLNFH
jgi:polar amino acid transport system substrate-binding protein